MSSITDMSRAFSVSLIIPFFVAPKKQYIFDRVVELFSEYFPDFIEVVLVDSTRDKGTRLYIKNACQQRDFVYVYSKQSAGYSLGKARNEGAAKASGDFLFFMDIDFIYSDVFWDALKQEVYHKLVLGDDSGFIMLPCLFLNKITTSKMKKRRDADMFSSIRDSVLEGDNVYVETLAIVSSTIIVSRAHFFEIGAFYVDYIGHGCEEFDLLHRLSMRYVSHSRPHDYFTDKVTRFPGDYQGFRKYFAYHSLPYLFSPLFLLHRYHPRSVFDGFYKKRVENKKQLQKNMKHYDTVFSVERENDGSVFFHLPRVAGVGDDMKLADYICDVQRLNGYPVDEYCGLFSYKKGVKIKRGSLLKRLRKLVREPAAYLADARQLKKVNKG